MADERLKPWRWYGIWAYHVCIGGWKRMIELAGTSFLASCTMGLRSNYDPIWDYHISLSLYILILLIMTCISYPHLCHMLLLWPNLELSFQVLAPSIRKLLRFDFAPMDARACACQGPASFSPRGLIFYFHTKVWSLNQTSLLWFLVHFTTDHHHMRSNSIG